MWQLPEAVRTTTRKASGTCALHSGHGLRVEDVLQMRGEKLARTVWPGGGHQDEGRDGDGPPVEAGPNVGLFGGILGASC